MQGYWITFADGSSGYCQGFNAYDARSIAEKLTGKIVGGGRWRQDIPTLPYPATPVIWQLDHPVNGKTPAFCISPEKCKGCTACPRPYSCTE